MNNSNGTSQAPRSSSALQPLSSQTQSTVGGFQNGSTTSQIGDSSATNALLSGGVPQSDLQVVAVPYSAAPGGLSPGNGKEVTYAGGVSDVAIFVIAFFGAIALFAAAGAWKRYVKTPVRKYK